MPARWLVKSFTREEQLFLFVLWRSAHALQGTYIHAANATTLMAPTPGGGGPKKFIAHVIAMNDSMGQSAYVPIRSSGGVVRRYANAPAAKMAASSVIAAAG